MPFRPIWDLIPLADAGNTLKTNGIKSQIRWKGILYQNALPFDVMVIPFNLAGNDDENQWYQFPKWMVMDFLKEGIAFACMVTPLNFGRY